MARHCEPCRFHTTDDTVRTCPDCGGEVKFTLLGPHGSDPDLIAADASRARKSQSVGLGDFLQGKLLVMSAFVVSGLFAAVFGVWYLRGDTFDDRTAKVKPGMRMSEAMRIMGDRNEPTTPPRKMTIALGVEGEQHIPDFDRPVETDGEGYVEYASGSTGVRIHYANHVVTKVEPYTPTGGLRKRVTIGQ